MRGISPLNGTLQHEILSGYEGMDQDPSMLYSPTNMIDFGRENSNSMSPNGRQKGMSTQFGNFLYQVDAKQFPGNRIAG